jgi:hypothetical protein
MLTVSVSTCAGLEKLNNTNEMYSVFPNPTSGKLTVQSNFNKNTQVTLEVIDVVGKIILKQNIGFTANDNTHTLNLSAMQDGLYIVRLTSSEGTQLIRIVKD